MDAQSPCRQWLTAQELSVSSGFSESTIWRYKRNGVIPFVQPAGKNGRVLFPADALDRVGGNMVTDRPLPPSSARLSGPEPKWRKSRS